MRPTSRPYGLLWPTPMAHGTAVFDASGDTAGLECKGGDDFSSPPGPDDVGVDAVASLPEMTSVGGTTLSTDLQGRWIAEQAWTDVPMSQGTSGGASSVVRPPRVPARVERRARDSAHRLVPDIAAVADPFTGVRIVFEQQPRLGGGTSQAAPIWAALTVLMNQYPSAHGGTGSATSTRSSIRSRRVRRLPGFRDVTLGHSAVDVSTPGTTWSPGSEPPTPTTSLATCSIAQRVRLTGHDRSPGSTCRPCNALPVAPTSPQARSAGAAVPSCPPSRATAGVGLRLSRYAPEPRGACPSPRVASSLFPHLPHRSRTPLRIGLAGLPPVGRVRDAAMAGADDRGRRGRAAAVVPHLPL